jgi:hypothetical protein
VTAAGLARGQGARRGYVGGNGERGGSRGAVAVPVPFGRLDAHHVVELGDARPAGVQVARRSRVLTEPTHSTRTPSRRQYSQQAPVIHELRSSVCATRGHASRHGRWAAGASITPYPRSEGRAP